MTSPTPPLKCSCSSHDQRNENDQCMTCGLPLPTTEPKCECPNRSSTTTGTGDIYTRCGDCGLPIQPTAEPKCCERCDAYEIEPPLPPEKICANPSCSCHTPPVEGEWENSLSKVIKEQEEMPASWGKFYQELVEFIEPLLHTEREKYDKLIGKAHDDGFKEGQAIERAKYEECVQCTGLREEFRKEVVEMIDEMKRPSPDVVVFTKEINQEMRDNYFYNLALSSLRDKLSTL